MSADVLAMESRGRYRPYPAYKDSGVEWLGEIPAHWDLKPVKHLTAFATGWTPPTGREDLYGGEHLWANIGDLGPKVLYTTETTISDAAIREARMRITRSGSLLFSFKLSVGTVSLAGADMYTNEAIASFAPSDRIDTGFLYWAAPVLVPHNAQDNIYGAPLLNRERIANASLVSPPLPEQRAIAAFLDRETARIDALVAKEERLIELLQEKRTALITRAVTKGLDPNVPMKDSGVEWLGEIPAHWKVCALRHVTLGGTRNGLYKSREYYQPEGTPMIQMGEAFASPVVDRCANDRLNLTPAERSMWALEEGDLLFARRSLVFGGSGKCSIVGELPELHVFESSLIRVRPNRNQIRPQFLFQFLQSAASRAQILAATKCVTISGVDSQQIKALDVLVPPSPEQQSIGHFIEAQGTQLDSLIRKIREAIDRLKELRTALISAAVTGKIDVREEAA